MHLFLILPLLLIVTLPLVALGAGGDDDRHVSRVRSEDGRDRIVIRRGGHSETFDMDALEDALSQLEELDIDIAELVEEALEGLEDMDFDFEPNFSGRWHFDDEDFEGFDSDAFEEWAEELGERMEEWGEEFSRRMERDFDRDGRGMRFRDANWRFDRDDDDRDDLRDEIRELKRQIRRLESELDDVRDDDDR
jgi:hypothetical protein